MTNLVQSLPLLAGAAQTLTAAAATFEAPFAIAQCEDITVMVAYTPAANTRNLTVTLEISPDPIGTAEGSSKWFPIGIQTNAAGTLSSQPHTYVVPGAIAATEYTPVPWSLADLVDGAQRLAQKARVRVLEDGASTFGTVKVWINTIPR